MASTVTVTGSNGTPVQLNYNSTTNYLLASQIAERINSGIKDGSLVTAFDTAGGAPTVPAGTTGVLVQTTSPVMTLSQAYPIDLVTKTGNAVVLGSTAADQTVLSDSATNLTFVAGAGSGTVDAGGSRNRMVVTGTSVSSWSLMAGDGNNVIAALGAVNATIGAGTGHNAISLGSGPDRILSTGDDTISGGSGNVTIDASGARSDVVHGVAEHVLFLGGSGDATIVGGRGSDTYVGSVGPTGSQLIEGGSAGNNLLIAGDGAATLVGGGNNDQLYAYGTSRQLLRAGAGNETLSAALSSGPTTLRGGSGQDQLIGGTGSDTFVGSVGQTTVTAGAGRSAFEFINHQAGGTELVQGLMDASSVHIALQGYDASAITEALQSQKVQNGSVTVSLNDGTRITFQDIASLDRSNFTSH